MAQPLVGGWAVAEGQIAEGCPVGQAAGLVRRIHAADTPRYPPRARPTHGPRYPTTHEGLRRSLETYPPCTGRCPRTAITNPIPASSDTAEVPP